MTPQPDTSQGLIATVIAIIAGMFKHKAQPVAAPEPDVAPIAVVPAAQPQRVSDGLTARAAAELIGHEAIVCEAYKDSKGIWTWGIGVTDASGHKVQRYIDNPQSVARCMEVFVWLLRTKYLPAVLRTFKDHQLTEAQLAAALSFHYNTGAIETALWPKLWRNGHVEDARASFMTWRKPPEIIERRRKERDLFFDGRWSGDGRAPVIPVRKPSYQPDFRNMKRVDVLTPLRELLG